MAKYPTVDELRMAIATICDARLKELRVAVQESPVSTNTVIHQIQQAQKY